MGRVYTPLVDGLQRSGVRDAPPPVVEALRINAVLKRERARRQLRRRER